MAKRRLRTVTAMARTTAAGAAQAEILHWPDGAERRAELVALGVPRLLVLDAGATPPPAADELEDWLWTPTDERDLYARLRRLADRQRAGRRLAPGDVAVDGDGVLTFGGRWVLLPPAEAAIALALATPPGQVHSRARLAAAAWGDTPRKAHSLDSRLHTLRARLAPLGLGVHAVRGRGFLLVTAPPGEDP